jgi:membrane peptidoglycan carboxypeptidase
LPLYTLQLAGILQTVANDGMWVQPRLVRGTSGSDGRLQQTHPEEPRRVLSEETATMLGWRRGTVKSRLARALGRLRTQMGEKAYV